MLLTNTTCYWSQKIDEDINIYGLVDVDMARWMLTWLIVDSDMACSGL
jgi:hypothetical protein